MMNSKDQLAKLMATEDITVQHSPSAKTASFDVKYRILTLPNWDSGSTAVTDLLIGHEVGHALWTKEEDWEHALSMNLHKGITNIVEDARIERKIKAKYPGLVKIMIKGYRELAARGFFYEHPDDIDSMNFIDRLNLHCKLGPLAAIPFENIELPYVSMTENTNTWESVESCVKSIMDFMGSDEYKEQQEQRLEEFGGGMPGNPSDDGMEMEMPGDDDDGEDEYADVWDKDGRKNGTENPHSSESFDDSDASDDLRSETQERFDEAVEKQLSADSDEEIHYFTAPTPTKEILVDYKTAHFDLKEVFSSQKESMEKFLAMQSYATGREHVYREAWDMSPDGFTKFRRNAQKIVGYMAKEFERKKSASEYRKESISKTGVLDMTKIHQYKYNDDLFLRNTIRPDGKSHGLIMLFDWSASMTAHLHDTMKQTLALAWFCQKVNVPFEVYAFTNSYHVEGEPVETRYVWNPAKPGDAYFEQSGRDDFKLVNILSSRMNSKVMLDQSRMLYILSDKYHAGRSYGNWGKYELSSTPLLEGLCAMQTILPAFKNKQKLDIVNMIILTDGEGNGRWRQIKQNCEYGSYTNFYGGGRGSDYRLQDPITKKVYSFKRMIQEMPGDHYFESCVQECMMIKMLKDRHDINVIGLFLDGRSNGKSLRKKTMEKYLGWTRYNISKHKALREDVRKNGVGTVFYPGHDEYYLVPVGTIAETDNELEIGEDWSNGKIKNAFKKNLNQKFGNKVLVNKMMDIIA